MINVTRAYLPDKKKLFGYIDKIYESAWLTNNSQFCQELELRLKEHLGARNLILVANGTLALQLVYKALEVKGSAVTTPFSFVATTSSLLWEGIRPIFADINAQTWNIEPENIGKVIAPDTTALVPVHVFGNPCEIDKIEQIAQKHDLKVIFDGAHAFGIKYKGESVLNRGHATTLSFHATKLFHTVEGGAIITSDDELARKIRLLINFGITGPETIECMGINCKMNEFQAVMGLCVLDEMGHINHTRQIVSDYYQNNLPSHVFMQQWNAHGTRNYQYVPVLFKSEAAMGKAQKALSNQQIFARRYFFPSLDSLKFTGNDQHMPVSQDIASRILCLPIYSELTIDEQKNIVDVVRAVVD